MAFKMKRAGMSLRSTTRVAPQLTQYQGSSPFNQMTIKGKDDEIVDIENITGAEVKKVTYEDDNNSSGGPGACDKTVKGDNLAPNSPACLEYKKHDERVQGDPCYQYMGANPVKTCGEGYTLNPNPTGGDRGTCCIKVTEGSEEEISNVTGNYTSPGQMQPSTHILNPREMRRNNRMLRIGSDGDERSIKKANKNIRQAIRRGQEPSENDLAIISGQALGNYDGLNTKQDSSGYKDWFTGQVYRSVQTSPGGEMGKGENYNDLVRSAAKDLYAADPSKYPDEASLLAAAEKATIQARTDGDGSDSRVAGGKYLSRRTRRLMEDRNVDTSRFGDYGKKGKSQKKKDRDARNVTKYTDKLKSAATADKDGNYKYNPDNEAGISRKQYDRTKRKSKKRGGKVSAFKKKVSPINMTVNVTKPSYKMGGFGSK
jgi:hypothetical protein